MIEPNHNETPIGTATTVALQVWETLRKHCPIGKCKVAGSIRRKKPFVKDLEIVCIPDLVEKPDTLFANKQVRCPRFIEAAASLGEVKKGQLPDGKYVQIWMPAPGMMLDLFMVETGNFGLQYLIRTGPWQYGQRILAEFNKRGYHSKDGYPQRRGELLAFHNEAEVYEYLELPFVKPENRY